MFKLKGKFPKIGDSKFHFGVWYRITNPHALYVQKEGDEEIRNPFTSFDNFVKAAARALKQPDEKELMIGRFARQPFNSVILSLEGDTRDEEIEWTCHMFLDTNELGADVIAKSFSQEEVFKRVVEILESSGAVLDVEKTQKEVVKYIEDSITCMENAKFLNNLIEVNE